jgi:putative molybdopterin biosynthesis protein
VKHLYLQSKPVEIARKEWLDRFAGSDLGEECIPVTQSLGRVLSRSVQAVNSSPHYAAAAMDGFAVDSRLTAGAVPGVPVYLNLGQGCLAVDTGDALPPECDAVIMIENVTISPDGEKIGIEQSVAPWQHVRPVGEDIVSTEMLLPCRHYLRPVDIGACLAAGVAQVWVFRRARVGIIPTGDEIVPPGSALKPGDIVEYNSHIVAGQVMEWGAHPVVRSIVRDDMQLLEHAIKDALTESDLVIVIAGSSAGRGDYTARALENMGKVMTHGVAMRPGKPVIMAEVNDKAVLGLPGYPVSAHLCLDQFVRPLLEFWRGGNAQGCSGNVTARLTRPVVSLPGIEEHVRVRVGLVDGTHVATPLNRGAGVLTSLVRADGQCVIPSSSEGVGPGGLVSVQLTRDRSEVEQSLVAIGSHDPALDVLDEMLRRDRVGFLSSSHVGSMGGIIALRKGECHMAGIHLLETDTGAYNIPFVRRYFAGKEMALLRLADRWQGFMVRPEFDADIGWHSLGKLRFVNRQKGSGTRLLLDHNLSLHGIDAASIAGYQREETNHLSVACAVLAKEADVGLGVRSVADAMGLKFIPLCLEQYDLLMEKATLNEPRMNTLLGLIRSPQFAARLKDLGGYSTERSGEIVWEGSDA